MRCAGGVCGAAGEAYGKRQRQNVRGVRMLDKLLRCKEGSARMCGAHARVQTR